MNSVRRWRRRSFGGLLLLSGTLLLAACAPKTEVIDFWAMGREGEVVTQLLPDFEREHPGVRVRVQQLPWTAAHEKLLTSFAGDATPDVAQLGTTWVPELAALGALEPLDARLTPTAVVQRSDYFEGPWSSNVLDGALVGIPWYVDTRVLYYRSDLLAQAGFKAPPQTWDEWRRMLAALSARDGSGRFGVLLPINEYDPLLVLGLQQDDALLRDGARWGNFRSPGFRTALGFYREMFEKGWAPPVSNNEVSNLWAEFARGYFAFYISGPWNIGEFKRRMPPEHQGHWMTAPMPGPRGLGASTAGGSSLVLFKRSAHKAAAWELVQYLSRPDVQERFHGLTGNLPPRRSVWQTQSLRSDPYAQAFRQQLERARPAPKVPEWERIIVEMQILAAEVAHNKRSVDDACTELDRRVDGFLEKRRWMLARGAAQ